MKFGFAATTVLFFTSNTIFMASLSSSRVECLSTSRAQRYLSMLPSLGMSLQLGGNAVGTMISNDDCAQVTNKFQEVHSCNGLCGITFCSEEA
jgi:DNA-binding IclR family transcriptional regulator